MKKNLLKILSTILAITTLALSFSGCGKKVATDNPILNDALGKEDYVQTEYTDIVKTAKKSETVYINAKPDGKIYNISVTDWLHTDTPQVRLEDTSFLKDIKNVNTLTKPVYQNDHIYWDMDTTDLYYSGKTDTKPPISFKIKYFLDGEEITAKKIAGQKGNIKIQITLENSLKKDVIIKNKSYSITCPLFVVGGTILNEDTFSNISIDHGTAISDGTKQIVFFTGIPGLDESIGASKLNLSVINKDVFTETYTISAYTEKFELGNIMLAATPLSSLDIIAESNLSSDIDGAKNVLSDIEKLQTAMNGLDVKKIINLLYGDVDKINQIMKTVSEASKIYKENEKMLTVMGAYMTPENMEKIDKLLNDLKNTDIDALTSTLNDPKLQLLLKFLPKLSESVSELSALADDINDVMPIFNALANDLEDPEIKKSIENLPKTIAKIQEMVTVLSENKNLLEAIGGLTSDSSVEKIEAITGIANKYADLDSLSPEDAEILADRTKIWLEYGSNYDIFTTRTPDMISNVMFTYKVDPIKVK